MHKPSELVDVAEQVREHLERLDLHEMIVLTDTDGKPMGVRVQIKDGMVRIEGVYEAWPLLYLMVRDAPWRGYGNDVASLGAAHLLAPDLLKAKLTDKGPGRSIVKRYPWATDGRAVSRRRFQQAAIGDAVSSALTFGTVEPIPDDELVDDLADQIVDAAQTVDVNYEQWGPEKRRRDASSMVHVEVSHGDVTIVEWTDMVAATGEPAEEGQEVTRQEATIELVELMDRGVKHRGTSGHDRRDVGIVDVLVGGDDNTPGRVRQENRERMIVNAALSYISYYGGEESWVSELGEGPDY